MASSEVLRAESGIASHQARRSRPSVCGWLRSARPTFAPVKAWFVISRRGVAATDLFVVPTLSFRLLYGLLIMRHDRRRILWLGVTAHPTAEWIARQLTEACGWDQPPKYLIRDRDGAYGDVFKRRLRAMGIRDKPTAPRSPWQNGHCERLIGSIRRECLDHVVVLGERHLRHVLLSYLGYYNRARTHLALCKDAPISRATQSVGTIRSTPILGGLHHQYGRI